MSNLCFDAVPVSPNVWWVGARDWSVRNFHGYETNRGSSYNAFLVIDEKVTVIDAVKAPFVPEMLARIASVIDPEKVDYLCKKASSRFKRKVANCIADRYFLGLIKKGVITIDGVCG